MFFLLEASEYDFVTVCSHQRQNSAFKKRKKVELGGVLLYNKDTDFCLAGSIRSFSTTYLGYGLTEAAFPSAASAPLSDVEDLPV